MKDITHLSINGFLKIYDPVTKEISFEGKNAIHYEHMSQALAWSISNDERGFIYKMAFGNGGTTVDPTGIITYLTPNSSGSNASLYNQTYTKIVDKNSSRDPARNYTQTRHVTGVNYSDIFITCLLDYGEPENQSAFDNNTSNDSTYVFDELGLISFDPSKPANEGLLLTHVVFHPVQKSLNRLIQIDYTIRIQTLSSGVC